MKDRDNEVPTVVERPSALRLEEVRAPRDPGAEAPPPAPVPSASRVVLSDVLGVGGMGIVYRASQSDLGRPIAYKRLIDAPTDEIRARFVREARLTAQLDHPNIVPVHLLDPGTGDEQSGYAMKLVDGKTLAKLVRDARETVARGEALDDDHALPARLEVFLKICDAIAFAHDRMIIHRDLKPENIMIGAFGAVYVMDWGIARPIGDPEIAVAATAVTNRPELTKAGMIIGSIQYMSPEQARGKNAELDARSDQYSLGLLLQELVTLERAIDASTEEAALEAAAKGKRAPLAKIDGKPHRVPRELRAIVGKATAFWPVARYASTRELADDVRRFLHGEEVRAQPDRAIGKLLRFASRHRRSTLAAFVGVIVLAALAITWTRYRHAERELAERERGARARQLYGEVARQAHRIDRDLFRIEEALEGLATSAEWALQAPEPPLAKVFYAADFSAAATRPADFTDRTAYRWPVSVDHMVVSVAPGVDREPLAPRIQRLVGLSRYIRDAVVRAAGVGPLEPEAARALLLARKSPIDYAYIDLPEGVHVVWPGIAALPPDYDVRTSSFYQQSDHVRGKRWGVPYVDATTDTAGDDLVLPCTRALWNPAGDFLGVAGVEITVTKMVETNMVLVSRTALRTSLVTNDGRVVIDSRYAGKRLSTKGRDEAMAFENLDIPEIADAIRRGEEGMRELAVRGKRTNVAFVRLEAIGWYYVVETDAATFGAR